MIENVQVVEEVVEEDPEKEVTEPSRLEGEACQSRLALMEQWWFEARQDHSDNRTEQDLDEQYRDHHQWTAEEIQALEDRGQKPTQFNVILPVCQWLSGTEKKTRIDGNVLPRDDSEEEGKTAEAKTKLLKYVSDVNKEPWERSDAFMDAVTVGVGWLELGIVSDETEEPIFCRHESWRNVWYDAHCRRRNVSKYGRYIFKSRWVDLEYLVAIWPERKEELKNVSEIADVYGEDDEDGYLSRGSSPIHQPQFAEFERRRVRVMECWHRFPGKCQRMHGKGPLDGKIYKEDSEVHNWAIGERHVTLHDAIADQVFCGLFIGGSDTNQMGMLLEYGPSPYDHNMLPLIPVWAYRDGKTGMPFGVVRGLRDIQQDMNKRWSKSLHILSTNRVMFEDGAVDDENEFFDELDRPDGKVRLKAGGLQKIKTETQTNLAKGHLDLMQMGRAYVNEVSGVTGENQGLETNATSGKAIIARQSQGMTISTTLFDNLRYAAQLAGEIKVSLIEQFYDQEKKLRILGDRGKAEWLELNTADGQNVLTQDAADFVIDDQDFHATMRQAMFESLLAMVSKLPPEIGFKMLDIVMEMSDLPNKEEWVKRIRNITGAEDPDAEDDPEEMERKQQEQEVAQEEEQRQLEQQNRAIEADIRDKEAGAGKKEADAALAAIKAQKEEMQAMSDALGAKLEAFEKALEVSERLQTNPSLGGTADGVIEDAMPVINNTDEQGGQ